MTGTSGRRAPREAIATDDGRRAARPRADTVAVVTGGSHGLGREVVRVLARRGYAIVVVYLDDQRSAEATVEEVFATAGTAVAVRADITDELDVERLFDETIAAFGGVDALVHTTTRSSCVLYEHAGRRLRRGSAIVSVSDFEEITPALAQRLAEHGITADLGVEDLVSFLDR
jgi:short subunit dehydrogenase